MGILLPGKYEGDLGLFIYIRAVDYESTMPDRIEYAFRASPTSLLIFHGAETAINRYIRDNKLERVEAW